MNSDRLETLCLQVQEIARRTGAFIREERKKFDAAGIESKGRNNFVTYVDKASEEQLVNALAPLLPGAGFITEEDAAREQSSEYNWVIDPLDGTTNFIHDIPCYAISIGLVYKNEPLLGVIYEVSRGECFYAWRDGGAFLDGSKIRVSTTRTLSESVIATGFPYDPGARQAAFAGAFGELIGRCRGQRRMGAAAVDMAYVACGRFDGYYEYGIHSWDVAAGIVIVREAGGKVTAIHPGADPLSSRQMVCGTPEVADELQEMLRKYF